MIEQFKPPYPGSSQAIKQGCQCPILDNEHGRGYLGDGHNYGWVVSGDCPMHGEKEDETSTENTTKTK